MLYCDISMAATIQYVYDSLCCSRYLDLLPDLCPIAVRLGTFGRVFGLRRRKRDHFRRSRSFGQQDCVASVNIHYLICGVFQMLLNKEEPTQSSYQIGRNSNPPSPHVSGQSIGQAPHRSCCRHSISGVSAKSFDPLAGYIPTPYKCIQWAYRKCNITVAQPAHRSMTLSRLLLHKGNTRWS